MLQINGRFFVFLLLLILTLSNCADDKNEPTVKKRDRSSYIRNNCVVDFSADAVYGKAPLKVQFKNNFHGVHNLRWDFGGGTGSSQEENPEYTYQQGGVYFPVLIADCPGSGSIWKTIPINVLKANFNSTICTNNNVEFRNKSKGHVDSYRWDFGDSITSSQKNPVHNYREEGIYSVTLTISYNNCTDSYTREINCIDCQIPDNFKYDELKDLATWDTVENATSYTYKIMVDGNEMENNTSQTKFMLGANTIKQILENDGKFNIILNANIGKMHCKSLVSSLILSYADKLRPPLPSVCGKHSFKIIRRNCPYDSIIVMIDKGRNSVIFLNNTIPTTSDTFNISNKGIEGIRKEGNDINGELIEYRIFFKTLLFNRNSESNEMSFHIINNTIRKCDQNRRNPNF